MHDNDNASELAPKDARVTSAATLDCDISREEKITFSWQVFVFLN